MLPLVAYTDVKLQVQVSHSKNKGLLRTEEPLNEVFNLRLHQELWQLAMHGPRQTAALRAMQQTCCCGHSQLLAKLWGMVLLSFVP